MHSERSEGGDVPTCSELTGERGDKLSFCCNDCQRLIYFGAWRDELETAASFRAQLFHLRGPEERSTCAQRFR